ncbi:MAG TPA: 1-deoxy-D-xylulose-5-phosphate synthase [Planctomycetota bacterium]|nr:MAG: 1-deoxy-D-xylulose-5-phosphate synthase [Planctomycetes bacterium ADurb.Bin069]HNS00726.1 1-deoxy-D-xylulose-5-phosphate synthase [Planctomycetota bacterium]HOE30733.1 1-deoxy-D-xylulose-5-phosphate synthase [Planctomycetota bacterium]HOE87911.1 1-deoxy-D-xylulose-5-phosphate synthase [Planctomycetota bacterium]HOR68447.1 1-deoxy-D-xylulose-5-phosphate synthase [Planctomycetota bacterium]
MQKRPSGSMLRGVTSPCDLREMDLAGLAALTDEIRSEIIRTVDANGGHLGSNLGVVELTLALHRVLDPCRDRLLWDVSHQAYAHKLLTGRAARFGSLRTQGGLCGFTNKRESPFDLFDAGHAGTAVSTAAGLATADALAGRPGKTVVVVGDASCACGVTFEGLNHAGAVRPNLLVVLNDNRMSISRSVGALSHYLHRIRTKPFWRELGAEVHKALLRIPVVGRQVKAAVQRVEDVLRRSLVPGMLFQELGFRYFGPVDGHDLAGLLQVLENIRSLDGPVLLHVHTIKGKGYAPATENPTRFHGCRSFLPDGNGGRAAASAGRAYTDIFSEELVRLGREHGRLCAVTAAMADGTGVAAFAEAFPDRAFDVGIAESHGACFSSGLSFGGFPVVYAVYSTFVQRAYDQIFHDVCLQSNPVVLCLDRAGIVGEDGPTHHGVFDIAALRHIPSIVLAAPRDGRTFRALLAWAVTWPQPVAIRYPREEAPPELPALRDEPLAPGKAEVLRRGRGTALFAYGAMVKTALAAADLCAAGPITVVDARFAKPLDTALLAELAEDHDTLVTLEDHALAGGFGSGVLEALNTHGIRFGRVVRLGIPDRFVTYGLRKTLLADLGLGPEQIARVLASLPIPAAPALTRLEAETPPPRRGARLATRGLARLRPPWTRPGAR